MMLDPINGRVLIVEDDHAFRRVLRTTLDALEFDIGEASNGEEALTRLRMVDYQAVLLDINMPGMGGLETCRRIRRAYTRLPIIMLTVRDGEDDKVEALEAGADDFVTKPFQIRELTARLRSAIRRLRAPATPSETPLTFGEVTLDPVRHSVEKAGNAIHLTPREFDLLQILMESAGRPVTHARLNLALRGPGSGDDREYVRVLVSQLRKKLETDSSKPDYVLTESYIGYRFRDRGLILYVVGGETGYFASSFVHTPFLNHCMQTEGMKAMGAASEWDNQRWRDRMKVLDALLR